MFLMTIMADNVVAAKVNAVNSSSMITSTIGE